MAGGGLVIKLHTMIASLFYEHSQISCESLQHFSLSKNKFHFSVSTKGQTFLMKDYVPEKGKDTATFFSSGLVDTLTKTKINVDMCPKN